MVPLLAWGLLISWVAEAVKGLRGPYVSNEMLDAFRYQHGEFFKISKHWQAVLTTLLASKHWHESRRGLPCHIYVSETN